MGLVGTVENTPKGTVLGLIQGQRDKVATMYLILTTKYSVSYILVNTEMDGLGGKHTNRSRIMLIFDFSGTY